MRLGLLGPAPPFRGGIVTYVAMLHRALGERGHAIHWAGFRRQYPGAIFPGSSQTGDTAPWMPRPDSLRFTPWSPRSWRRTADDLLGAGVEAVIVKYWLPFFAPGFGAVARRLRGRGVPVVYILDNVVAHERYPFAAALTRWALGPAAGYVAQSGQVRRDLFAILPGVDPARVRDCPHPVYDFGVPGRPRKTRPEARAALDLPADARVVLYFGFIKAYKGVEHLIDAAPLLRGRYGDALRLLIVGDVYGDARPYRERIAGCGAADIIRFVDGYVPDDRVEDHFLAADLVVLPYVSATQSGIVQIAYNYDKPVVSTRVGGLPEVVLDGRTGYLVPPGDPAALAAAVARFFDEDRAADFAAAVAVEKEKYGWSRMVDTLEDLIGAAS
ncbi:glycosyltransferase [bacterium]|nr:glycosyltransferase [bacterium]MBU1676006.1 glycosyltransferase [bacterium]